MNIRTIRMKHSKKAVTPVIATIILIAATIVLALVVGAYTFGLFGSNVKTVTLVSATLYGGVTETWLGAGKGVNATSSLSLSLNNPGSASTITSLTLTGTALSTPITVWSTSSESGTSSVATLQTSLSSTVTTPVDFNAAYAATAPNANSMAPGSVSTYSFYPASATVSSTTVTYLTSQPITTGQTFNYVINFANGQSVSGALIAQ